MIRRIIHCGDIHIRLLKRHAEYRRAFQQFYDDICATDLTDTIIFVAGDIVHAKTDMSPEMIELTSDFLGHLSSIAPTYVIPGNHDLNLANKNRLDALSPIIENIRNQNLHYLSKSGIYNIDNIDLAVFSLLDSNWPRVGECRKSATRIGCYHGPVHGASTDVGFVVSSKSITVDLFAGYDLVLLGDIHKTQFLTPTVAYCGSLIQQNHGENYGTHGWLDWDLTTKTATFRELKNPTGYYTLRVQNGVVPDYSDMPEHVRLRIFSDGLSEADIKKLQTVIRSKHNIEELSVTTAATKVGPKQIGHTNVQFLDIHDVDYQAKLITDYLKATPAGLVDKVLKLNRELNERVTLDDPTRKVLWKPLYLKFDNLFTYEEGNELDFQRMKGTMGLFAPNASGKSSLPDAICFALYDRTPRTTKASSIMNTRKDTCSVEFRFEIDGVEFVIQRRGKRDKNGDVKIDVNFYKLDNGQQISLNGTERRYTDINIRNYIGNYDDFLVTAFSTQGQNALFVDRGQSDRKDMLSQFLGLTLFDKLHLLANEDIKEISTQLRQFRKEDFTKALLDTQQVITIKKREQFVSQEKFRQTNLTLDGFTGQIQKLYEQKTPLRAFPISKDQLQIKFQQYTATCADLQRQKDRLLTDMLLATEVIVAWQNKWGDGTQIEGQYRNYREYGDRLHTQKSLLPELESSSTELNDHINELDDYHFDPECEFCVTNSTSTVEARRTALTLLVEKTNHRDKVKKNIEYLQGVLDSGKDIPDEYRRYQDELTRRKTAEAALVTYNSKLVKLDLSINEGNGRIDRLLREIEQYQENEEAITKNAELDAQIKQIEDKKSLEKKVWIQQDKELKDLHSQIVLAQGKRQEMLDRIEQAKALEDQFQAYEIYLKMVGRDGLPYKLVSEVLPVVQAEITDTLSQCADFNVELELDGKNINARIVYDDNRRWPLELASGMEKMISSLCIRIALMHVSTLPKSNFLIVDEGLGTLDADNLNSITFLFDLLKVTFEWVLLISHVDAVRDIADTLIDLQRNQEGYSKLVLT